MINNESLSRRRWMRRATGLTTIAALGACGGAQAVWWLRSTLEPQLWISEESVDFGEMAPLTAASRSLVLRNVGGESLEIRDIQTSCACTAAELPTRQLTPGSEAVLNVTFTASDAPFSQATITLTTNDPKRQVRFIELSARKPWGVDVAPRKLFFSSLGASQEVYVSATRDDIFKDDNEVFVTSATNFVTTAVIPDRGRLRAVVVVRRSNVEVTGAYASSIRIRDKRGLIDEKVSVQLAEQSQLFVPLPEVSISWPLTDVTSQHTEQISVFHRTGEPVDITSIDVDGEVQHAVSLDGVRNEGDRTIVALRSQTNGKRVGELARLRGYILLNACAEGRAEIFSLPISVRGNRPHPNQQ